MSSCCVFILKIASSSLPLELPMLVLAVADNRLYQALFPLMWALLVAGLVC